MDSLGSLQHSRLIFLRRCSGFIGVHSADPLLDGLGGHYEHVDALIRSQFCRLLGGQDDVAVIGQHEHRLAAGLAHGIQDGLRAGVHGLTAGDDLRHPHVLEHSADAVSVGHGHNGFPYPLLCGFFRRRRTSSI